MNIRAYAFFASLALALFGCSSSEDPPEERPRDPSELALELASLVDAAAEQGFSGSVRVSAGGEALISEGRGFADRERGLENGEHTAFDVGSLMKSVTAIAVFKLMEEGALGLEDRLGSLLPDVPEDKEDITLLQILQHRAGFDTYHDTEGDFEPMTRLEARARIFAQELRFPPGTREHYSNSGYTLLADLVETTSGRAFTDFVREELFEPAGMRETGFYSEPLWERVETAIGYGSDTFGENDPATWPYTWALVGNGGLVTTVLDLDAWIGALFGGALLEPETWELVESEYLGAEDDDEPIFGEAGAGDFGLGGVLIYAPGPDLRVLLGSNAYDAFDVEEFAVELAETALDALEDEP